MEVAILKMEFPENIFTLKPEYPTPRKKKMFWGHINVYDCPFCGRACGSKGSYGTHLWKRHGISRLCRLLKEED
jgi:hypothetical protein